MSRVGVTGDLHIERLVNLLPGDTVGLQLTVFRRMLARCRALGITTLVVAGDLFDNSAPDPDTPLRLADLLKEFPDVHVIVLPGNHDRPLLHKHSLKTLSWLGRNAVLPLEVVLDPEVRVIDGLPVFLCPHPFIEDQPGDAAVSIGHFPWSGAKRDNGTSSPTGSTPAGDWVLGDFHTAQAGDRFRYVGSPSQVQWHEPTLGKGFDVIQTNRAGDLSYAHLLVRPSYILRSIEVACLDDLEQIDPLAEGTYYQVAVAPEVQLPPDWQRQYPSIRRRTVLGEAVKLKAQIARVNLSDDPFEGMGDWMTQRGNLQPEQIDWSVNYLNELYPAPA